MASTTETLRQVPTTTIHIGHVTYVVRLDKRTGMDSEQSYDAEISRIVKMVTDAGLDATIESVR